MLHALSLGLLLLAPPAPQSSPPELRTISEESPCNAPLQIFDGGQLVELQIDPESLKAVAIYLKKLPDNKGVLTLVERAGCEAPWAVIKSVPMMLKKKQCVPTKDSQCL